jgi:hypothetical protein
MIFELTISGLCLIVVKATDKRPTHPDSVDIICPRDDMHRPRLSFSPDYFRPPNDSAALAVDTMGTRIASIDLWDTFLKLEVSPYQERFTMAWADETPEPGAEQWMNWVPTLKELGLDDLELGEDGEIPEYASTRLTLPKGEIFCRDIVKDPDTNEYLIWQFVGASRSIANQVIYRASGIEDVVLRNEDGNIVMNNIPRRDDDVVRMSFCNDLAEVTRDYYDEVTTLRHLAHLEPLTGGSFQLPRLVASGRRTESPICNQTICVNGYDGDGKRDDVSDR